jgi:uncharacterized protein (TIGR02452 family)
VIEINGEDCMFHNRTIDVFQETLKVAKDRYNREIAEMKKKAVYYVLNPQKGTLQSYDPRTQKFHKHAKVKKSTEPTKIDVKNNDSFLVAQELVEKGFNPLVLDMANKISVGGGVVDGSVAQEEELCRVSTLYLGLEDFGTPFNSAQPEGRLRYREVIPEFGSIYVPGVTVFRNSQDQYQFLAKPFNVDVIVMSGYDLGNIQDLEESLKKLDLSGNRDGFLLAFKEKTKIKIRSMFDVALTTGHDSLVLGALSCGAFKLYDDSTDETAQLVVAAYREVLQEEQYSNAFKHISFAVLDNPSKKYNNFTVFNNADLTPKPLKIGNYLLAQNRIEIPTKQSNEVRRCCELSMPMTTKEKLITIIAFLESKGCEIYQVHDFNNFTRIKVNPANFDELVAAAKEMKQASPGLLTNLVSHFKPGSDVKPTSKHEQKSAGKTPKI